MKTIKALQISGKHLPALTLAMMAANVANANLIVNGDFDGGNAGFTSGYGYVTGVGGLATGGDDAIHQSGEGLYAVGTNPNFYHSAFTTAGDHTTGSGNMMIVNGSTVAGKNVWEGTLNSPLIAGDSYSFSVWVMNVYHDGQSGHEDANLEFSIGSTVLGTFSLSDPAGTWRQFTASYTAVGGELPSAIDLQINYYANDFALDDISLIDTTIGTHGAVPETSTILAGALMLLPFGIGAIRSVRKDRNA